MKAMRRSSCGHRCTIARYKASPDIVGSRTSSSTASTGREARMAYAASGSAAVRTRYPSGAKTLSSAPRSVASSSTISTVRGVPSMGFMMAAAGRKRRDVRHVGAPRRTESDGGARRSYGGASDFRGNEADADGVAHQCGDLVDDEPLHRLRPVGLDGFDAQLEPPGDLAGGIPLGDEPQHFELAGAEPFGWLAGVEGPRSS